MLATPAQSLLVSAVGLVPTSVFSAAGRLAESEDPLGGALATLLWLSLSVLYLAAYWIIYRKAGQLGWAALVPIYNAYVLLKMVGRPGWWLILMLIPLVNVVIGIITMLDLARVFGKGIGFALGLIFLSPVFILILAFGSAEYVGPEERTYSYA